MHLGVGLLLLSSATSVGADPQALAASQNYYMHLTTRSATRNLIGLPLHSSNRPEQDGATSKG
jgi:hypothetical protein